MLPVYALYRKGGANQAAQFSVTYCRIGNSNVQQAFMHHSRWAQAGRYMPLNQMQNFLNPLLEVAAAYEWTLKAAQYYGLEGSLRRSLQIP